VFLQAVLELPHELHRWPGSPAVAQRRRWILFLWISDEEIDGSAGDLGIDEAPLVEVIDGKVTALPRLLRRAREA
jgi:hypothetical protein